MRDRTGYDGPVDIVCHSFGACIARQCAGSGRRGGPDGTRVRQLTMLGPPNNGSSLAELFSGPDRGRAVTARLAGVFVPSEFDPLADPIVQDMRPGSPDDAGSPGRRHPGRHRLPGDRDREPCRRSRFFPWFGGKTWELDGNGRFRQTLHGDGVVARSESVLPGVPLEVLAPGTDGGRQIPPLHFCHIRLPRNPAVIDRVMEHLLDPAS